MKRQENTTLYINPVPRISAQGRHKQVYTVQSKTGEFIPTTGMNKNKEFGVPSEYSFRLNLTTNKLITGLDKMIENPFKDLEPETVIETYGLSQDWLSHLKTIVKQNQIKLQTKYEILDNVGYNFYTSDVTGTMFSSNWKQSLDKERNYLETFKIILYDAPNRFTDETPRGRIAIQLLKNHPKVAKNKQEVNASTHDWYISEENEAQMEKQKRRDIIEDAIGKWYSLKSNSTPYNIYMLATLLTNHDNTPIVKGKMRDSTVKENISDYLHEQTSYQLENIEKFTKLYDMLQDKDNRERFRIMYLVGQAINNDIITIRDGFYIWHSKINQPNMYKHTTYDALVSSLQREYNIFNSEDKDVTNWYKDLYEELTVKNVWLE
jgi:hypothetical protein